MSLEAEVLTERQRKVPTPRSGLADKALPWTKILVILAILLFTFAVIRNAWLYDDAYITYRTVDNFVNGYGLTWNSAERVQSYTHPLWMFIVSGLYFFTREMYFSSLCLCISVSVVAVLVLAFGIAESRVAALLGITILTFSKAFVDYSTSGLENPPTHLLLALFLFLYLRQAKYQSKFMNLFWLSLLAALGALNRMDTILLFLPPLVYALAQAVELKRWQFGLFQNWFKAGVMLGLGFVPFILWEVFSLFYYGFPFPNTAYAKLNTSVDQLALAQQGLFYLLNSLKADPLTLLVIAISLALPWLVKKWSSVPVTLGILLYLIYVVRIGGDFMSGRFLTAPLFVAVSLVVRHLPEIKPPAATHFSKPIWALAFVLVLGVGLSSPYPPLLNDVNYGLNFEREELREEGIQDGRGIYYQYSGLLNAWQNRKVEWPNHSWSVEGREARANGPAVMVKGAIGFFGFYAGPQVHIVDHWALGDPLLARLPAEPDWQIGHFTRKIPAGYIETLQSGRNQIHNKNLAAYYDKLSVVTRGNLFDVSRLEEIWKFNTGQYDYLLADYPPLFHVKLAAPDDPATRQAIWTETDKLTEFMGIQIDLSRLYYAKQMQITLGQTTISGSDEERDYELVYFKGNLVVGKQNLQVPAQLPTVDLTRPVEIVTEASTSGFDQIRVLPKRSETISGSIYAIKDIKLVE